MSQLRFVADSHEALIELARRAEPPIQAGDRAELVLTNRRSTTARRVVLESTLEDQMIVWREVDR